MAVAGYLSKQQVIPAESSQALDYATELAIPESRDRLDEGSDLSECPDCQGELTQYYDWDTVNYRCENCGILISNEAFLKEES